MLDSVRYRLASQYDHRAPDDGDSVILKARVAKWVARKGPRVGDFVDMLDGRRMRFSHDWGDSIQTSEGGSFYFDAYGVCDFSGGLEPAKPRERFVDTGEQAEGYVWFFHHDDHRAHNGIGAWIPCRIYRELPK